MITVFVSILFWRGSLPATVELFSGSKFLSLNPRLSVTTTSWAITVALFASTLKVLTTASASGVRRDPLFYWVILNAFLILDILAVNSDNFYISIMAFGGLDVLEILSLTRFEADAQADRRYPITNFAVQTFGLFLIIIAGLVSGLNLPFSTTSALSTTASTMLVFGLFLRSGIFPTPIGTTEQAISGSWHNNIHLFKFLALTAFVSRVPALGLNTAVSTIFQVIFAVFGVYAAWTWINTRGAASGLRHFLTAASIIAVLDLLIVAQTSISALMLFVIILTSLLGQPARRDRVISIYLLVISLLSLGLPFTYSSSIWQTAHTESFISLPLVVSHYLLVFGFIRHVFEDDEKAPQGLRSLSLIATGMMVIISILFGIWGWEGAAKFGIIWLYLPLLLFYVIGLVAIFRFRQVLLVLINVKMPFVGGGLNTISSGFARTTQWFDGTIQILVNSISTLSEGKGALLWTILILLIVLLSLQGGV